MCDVDYTKKMLILHYFLLKLISRKNAIIVLFLSEIDFTKKWQFCIISFWNWFHEKMPILHYFFLKLISRKKKWKKQSYIYVAKMRCFHENKGNFWILIEINCVSCVLNPIRICTWHTYYISTVSNSYSNRYLPN